MIIKKLIKYQVYYIRFLLNFNFIIFYILKKKIKNIFIYILS